jgi:Tellurite resistance protein TerB
MPEDHRHLQVAFTYHLLLEAIRSDGSVDGAELDWLEQAFPMAELRRFGFVDAAGHLTPAFDEARDRAQVELSDVLTTGEKLGVVELVAEAVAADGVLTAEEVDLLAAAGRMLSLPDRAWREHLDGMLSAGRLRRDG